MEYTSLTHLIKGHVFTNEEFWQIIPFGETIVFRSFSAIYVYGNDKIEVLNQPFVINTIMVHGNRILVAGNHSMLYWMDRKK